MQEPSRRRQPFVIAAALLAMVTIAVARLPEAFVAGLLHRSAGE